MKLPSLLRLRVYTWSAANLNVSSTDPTCKLIHQRTPKMETKAKNQVTPSHTHTHKLLNSQAGYQNPNSALGTLGIQAMSTTTENQWKRETFEAQNAKRECQKTVDAYTQSMKQVNYQIAKWTHRHHSLVWFHVRLRMKHSLTSTSNTKERKKYPNSEHDTSSALGNEMTSVLWRKSSQSL